MISATFAYSHQVDIDFTGAIYGKMGNAETFISIGTTAADQNISNYVILTVGDY